MPPQSLVQRVGEDIVRLKGITSTGEWLEPSLVLLSDMTERPSSCWPLRLMGIDKGRTDELPLAMEMAPGQERTPLRGSWGPFERTKDGVTFVWATGLEAGVAFRCAADRPVRLRVRLWAYPGVGARQRVRGLVNGHEIGRTSLRQGPQELEVAIPKDFVRKGANLLVFQFALAIPPAPVNPRSQDRRPLACAFDQLELSYGSSR